MERLPLALLALGLVLQTLALTEEESLLDTTQLEKFVDELPDMPRIHGYHSKGDIMYPKNMTVGMFMKTWKFHRDIPSTPVFAYGESKAEATVPGPTIEALYGVPINVKWENHLPSSHILPWDRTIPTATPASGVGVPTVVHVHGNIGESGNDGFSLSWFTNGFREVGPKWSNKTYHYLNFQHPGNLWYHDHAMGLTRVNLLAGLMGAYIIRHPDVENPLGLPSGKNFDRPLIIFDRQFRSDGSIFMNSTGDVPSVHPEWQPEYFGNAIVVNGKVWPRLSVQRRKYRFRIINACNARFLLLSFSNGLKFVNIGSDSAYLRSPVTTTATLIAPSETADVVVDFSKSKTDTVVMENHAPYPYPSGDPAGDETGVVMKFFVDEEPVLDPSRIPENLVSYPVADPASAVRTRYITLYENENSEEEPINLLINGKSFDDPATEISKEGTSEIWNIINLTEDNHPLHIHLALFSVLEQVQLVNKKGFHFCMSQLHDAEGCDVERFATGNSTAVPAYEQGWKNVFKMQPWYLTRILVRFGYIHTSSPYIFDPTLDPGYVYHCHILDHEDNFMMRPLKLVK